MDDGGRNAQGWSAKLLRRRHPLRPFPGLGVEGTVPTQSLEPVRGTQAVDAGREFSFETGVVGATRGRCRRGRLRLGCCGGGWAGRGGRSGGCRCRNGGRGGRRSGRETTGGVVVVLDERHRGASGPGVAQRVTSKRSLCSGSRSTQSEGIGLVVRGRAESRGEACGQGKQCRSTQERNRPRDIGEAALPRSGG